jgi:hypothetical protein
MLYEANPFVLGGRGGTRPFSIDMCTAGNHNKSFISFINVCYMFQSGRPSLRIEIYDCRQSNSVITLSKENSVIYMSVAVSDLYAESEGKIFQDIKYRLASILHYVNAVVYFKFQLQLKFRHKNYSSATVNCHMVYAK